MVKSKISRMDKIIKDKSKPGPGDYDAPGAFAKTQTRVYASTMAKTKIISFAEETALRKKNIPSSDAYNVTEKAYDKISRSPKSLMRMRP